MQDEDSEIELVVPVEENEIDSIALGKTIWNEITAGVGIWGAFRPVFAVVLSLIPFLYLGQHFNRNHQRGFANTFGIYFGTVGAAVRLVDI